MAPGLLRCATGMLLKWGACDSDAPFASGPAKEEDGLAPATSCASGAALLPGAGAGAGEGGADCGLCMAARDAGAANMLWPGAAPAKLGAADACCD